MKTILPIVLASLAFVGSASADIIKVPSPHSVSETINRLEAEVKNAGATVFARIDHAKGAEAVGMELEPATLLIFGSPQVGTSSLQQSATMGLDLPLRVMAYEDSDTVWVAYSDPSEAAARHGIPEGSASTDAISTALENLTSAATAQ